MTEVESRAKETGTEELIRLLRDHPEDALPQVIEQNMGLFHHVVGRVSYGQEDREELFQEIILKFMEVGASRLLKWESGRSAFSTYLYLVVWGICQDCRRRLDREDFRKVDFRTGGGEREENNTIDRLPGKHRDPRTQATLLEAAARLESCFEKLIVEKAARKPDWLLVGLRVDGASAREVGSLLGLSEDTVNQRYRRLRQRLRECLAEHGFGSLEDVVSDSS